MLSGSVSILNILHSLIYEFEFWFTCCFSLLNSYTIISVALDPFLNCMCSVSYSARCTFSSQDDPYIEVLDSRALFSGPVINVCIYVS